LFNFSEESELDEILDEIEAVSVNFSLALISYSLLWVTNFQVLAPLIRC